MNSITSSAIALVIGIATGIGGTYALTSSASGKFQLEIPTEEVRKKLARRFKPRSPMIGRICNCRWGNATKTPWDPVYDAPLTSLMTVSAAKGRDNPSSAFLKPREAGWPRSINSRHDLKTTAKASPSRPNRSHRRAGASAHRPPWRLHRSLAKL